MMGTEVVRGCRGFTLTEAIGRVAGTTAVAYETDLGVFAGGEVGPAVSAQHVTIEVLSGWFVP